MRARSLPVALLSLFALLGAASCRGSAGDGPTGSDSSSHGLTINATISASSVSDAIQEAALLVDGSQVGQSVVSTNGTFTAQFNTSVGTTAGTHTVAIKMVKQKYASVTYSVIGVILASNSSTSAIVQANLPSTATLAAGGTVQTSVVVP